jgi:flavin reductase (DIM6/NTAB) family NADH-FMN oxidoreductase RutF
MSSSWVTQVSGTPPLVAIAVGRDHRSHALLAESGLCALNVLSARTRHLEGYFFSDACRRPDNLDTVAHEIHPTGAPVLSEIDAALVCRVRAAHETGDHTLFITEVVEAIVRRSERPLSSQDLEYVYVGRVIRR